ncbi:aspartyl protease family protein [Nonomuraea angiospora]|uniref:Tetratricopeptide (TPR) repeat protein n=1 Tax=Nonomuraea angiospora TaxID=46172 RepID=A0ABR9M2R1_9ACTN|nr:aspartyl protease family protein [Nonomuraea angiospora]MBE1587176.1 tetratricopeptide (TPR) repeat protein [Nonomuraea angiospora]
MADDRQWDRRSLLRGAAVLAGGAAAAPLLGGAATALAGSGDADALFKAGKFEEAGRAYEEILKKDPKNLHAARQRGYVGLLANRFADAEKYLKMALALAPDDKNTNYFLADCYIRQDKLALSAPHWKAAGEDSYAKWFAAVRGEAYQIHGETARLPFQQMDPMPLVEASVNGGPTKRFTFYTGAPNLSVRASVAKEAGLSPVASQKTDFEGSTIWAYWGILDSFKLGGIELRNVPVGWSSTESGEDVGIDSDGLIGTWVFYHLLTTFDYAGRQLILRRRTPETARKARAAAARAGADPLPLWLAREQYLHSTGSFAGVAGSRTGVVGVNFGGVSEIAAGMVGETAKQLGVRADYDRQIGTFAQSHPAAVYPCYPKEIRLGNAVAKEVYCYTNPNQKVNVPWPYGTGIDTMGWFSHCFWKPYNITVDFTDMNLYIARGEAA